LRNTYKKNGPTWSREPTPWLRACCSQCAVCAQSCVSQWFSWKHKLLSAAHLTWALSRSRQACYH